MTDQTEALRLADRLDLYATGDKHQKDIEGAAAELRRLDEAHDWQHKMAGDRLRRIEKLERTNTQLMETLKDIAYQLEKARIWGGMDWHYNPLHPIHYLPARDKARAAIAAAKEQA